MNVKINNKIFGLNKNNKYNVERDTVQWKIINERTLS